MFEGGGGQGEKEVVLYMLRNICEDKYTLTYSHSYYFTGSNGWGWGAYWEVRENKKTKKRREGTSTGNKHASVLRRGGGS